MNSLDEKDNEIIKRAILEVIVFFDIFDLPLTVFAIWQSLKIKTTYNRVLNTLENDLLTTVEKKGPFYFLSGRRSIQYNKIKQAKLAQTKEKVAYKTAKLLRFINGIKMVAVCNNFYYAKESDVDIFIIIQKNRMWISRFLITFLVHLSRLRRHNKKINNRACLSFYISENNLNIKNLSLPDSDPYLCFWAKNFKPIYDDNVYNSFWEHNSWLKESFPNKGTRISVDRCLVKDNFLSLGIKKLNFLWFDSFVGNILEKMFKKIQLKKINNNQNSNLKKNDTGVVVSDTVLKFHENDRRREFKEKFINKMNNLKNKI